MSADRSASVLARLLNRSRSTGENYNLLLSRFAIERLLYRLSVSPHAGNFVLKGALLFALWYDTPHRPTKDADLLGFGADDGCKFGWVAIAGEGSALEYELFASMRELLMFHRDARRLAVDIPIGLPWRECPSRPCDDLARRALRHRHVCVFAAPSRVACQATTKAEARRRNQEELGKSLSEQALGICAKVAEVDALLLEDASARNRVGEVHPEVCFWAMNRGEPLGDGKATRTGIEARLKLLSHRLPQAGSLLTRVLAEHRRAQVKADDVLDALAAYLVAAADPAAVLRLRGDPSVDLEGLPMEMSYIE